MEALFIFLEKQSFLRIGFSLYPLDHTKRRWYLHAECPNIWFVHDTVSSVKVLQYNKVQDHVVQLWKSGIAMFLT